MTHHLSYYATPLGVYVALIVAANWLTATYGLIPIGFGLSVTAGTFAAGGVLLARDWVQVRSGRAVVLVAIAVGALLTWAISTPALAVASGVAFAVSEGVDWSVFTPLRERSLPAAVLVSSVVSAPIDTVLFLHLAGFGVTWQAVLGQFIVKTAMAAAVAGVIHVRSRRAVSERG